MERGQKVAKWPNAFSEAKQKKEAKFDLFGLQEANLATLTITPMKLNLNPSSKPKSNQIFKPLIHQS